MGLFSKNKNKSEKRTHARHELFQATYYRMKDDTHKPVDCLIHNISMGGMLVEAKDCPETGSRIVVVVNLGGRLLHEKMEVVRTDKIITPRFGCHFIDETTREKREALLADFLGSLGQ